MIPTPKFYAFAGPYYYPAGGMADLFGIYSSVQNAKDALSKSWDWDWAHIATESGETVWGEVRDL